MKISTLIEIILIAILIWINLLVIEPFMDANRWAAYGVSLAMFGVVFFLLEKLESRFEFFRKKVDGQMGAWFVAALLLMPFFLSMV